MLVLYLATADADSLTVGNSQTRSVASRIYVGTAGWSIPRAQQARFPAGGSHLARYSRILPAVEINTTFYRPHRAETFARWAATVPRAFRFSVKLPGAITHEHRLADCGAMLKDFVEGLSPLGSRLACLLAQLPPTLEFDARLARAFFSRLRKRFDRGVALEPRHASWFTAHADRLLVENGIARVAADPPRVERGDEPGGWQGLAYYRLHGAPRTYYSAYPDEYLDSLAVRLRSLRRRRLGTWCIFDNTASGAATGNAIGTVERLT